MNSTRRAIAGALLLAGVGVISGCSKKAAAPVSQQPAEDQAQQQAVAAYQKLIEESKARVAASSAASAPGAAAPPEPADAYQVERWLSNLGYQRNLAARIRQDINLFALLVPEMVYFAQSARYDKTYLASGIKNKPLVDIAAKSLMSGSTTAQLTSANNIVITEPFRTFVIVFSSSFYEGPRFLKFLSEPLDISQWRMQAIGKFNQLVAFDRTQSSILRAVGPTLLARFPLKDGSARAGLIDQLASNLALYRTAWGMKEMSDHEVYQLLVAAAQPGVSAAFATTADAMASAAISLANGMNAALPPTLAPKGPGVLASLEALPPARN